MEKELKIEQRESARSFVTWSAMVAFTCFQLFFLWHYRFSDGPCKVDSRIAILERDNSSVFRDVGALSLRTAPQQAVGVGATLTNDGLKPQACGLKGSDKFAPHQRYDHVYCEIFTPLKTLKNLRMLEIGFGCGHHENGKSALVWTNFFNELQYFGVDFIPSEHGKSGTEEKCVEVFNKENPVNKVKKLWFGDQANSSFLREMVADYHTHFKQDKWDIIIDDGGHAGDQQIISFEELWPFVADGGYYVVEDLQFDGYRTFAKYAARWSRLLAGSDASGVRKNDLYISLADPKTHKKGVNNIPPGTISVTCAWQMCVVRKGFGQADLPQSGERQNYAW